MNNQQKDSLFMLAEKIHTFHQGIFGEISLMKAIVGNDDDSMLIDIINDYNEGFYKLKEFIHKITDIEMSMNEKKEIIKRRTNASK